MEHEATLEFVYEDGAQAGRIAASIRPEVGDIDDDRTSAAVSRDRERLTVHIDARDLTGLRAGVNTWCSLVGVAESVTTVSTG